MQRTIPRWLNKDRTNRSPVASPRRTIIASAVAGVVSVLLVAPIGCRDRRPATNTTTVLLADTNTSPTASLTWDAAIALFKSRHPGVMVERRTYKDDDYESYALASLMQSNRPPDVYFEWAGYAVCRDAGAGVAADLTSVLNGPWASQFDARAWAGTSCDPAYAGRYMVPVTIDLSNGLWYRRSVLNRAGIHPPTTWSELLAACRQLKAAGIQPMVQGNQAGWPAGNWAAHLAEQYVGLSDYRKAGTLGGGLALNSPGFLRALKLLEELFGVGAFGRDINTINDSEGVSRFNGGEGAFHFNGVWLVGDLTNPSDIGLLGYLAPPGVPAKPYSVLAGSNGYMVHARTPHADLAVDLIKAYTSLDVQKGSVARGSFSSLPEAVKGVDPSSLLGAAARLIAGADHFAAAPDVCWHPRIADRFYEAVKMVVGGKASAQAALDAAAADVAAMK